MHSPLLTIILRSSSICKGNSWFRLFGDFMPKDSCRQNHPVLARTGQCLHILELLISHTVDKFLVIFLGAFENAAVQSLVVKGRASDDK